MHYFLIITIYIDQNIISLNFWFIKTNKDLYLQPPKQLLILNTKKTDHYTLIFIIIKIILK